MSARLVSYKDGKQDLAFPVADALTAIGRSPDNLIQLTDPDVSKYHAAVFRKGDVWHLKDVGSKNGVFVNGKRVREATLKHGDKLTIGSTEFVFEVDVKGGSWVPDHVIDFSTKIARRTEVQPPTSAIGKKKKSP
ncbi:MAG: FHA domain-containing protein [Verrucomicrobia bacterium]|nr:FHA domain-containing protein [Verrucomicrobiota bacterium]